MTIHSFDSTDVERMREEDALLAEQVKIVDDYIVINVTYEYNIPVSSCSTHEQILHWVWHLADKTWMTQDVTKRFIELACRTHGLQYRN